jgi:predicted ester cyclase
MNTSRRLTTTMPRAWASHYTQNAVVHDPQYPEPLRGREAIQKDVEDFLSAFPDMHFTVTSTLVSDNRGAIEGIGAGTHRGPMAIPGGTIPPTNRQAKVAFVAMIELDSSGLISEERRYYDVAGMMQQLGLMPEAPAA